jgi:hypothetical protein
MVLADWFADRVSRNPFPANRLGEHGVVAAKAVSPTFAFRIRACQRSMSATPTAALIPTGRRGSYRIWTPDIARAMIKRWICDLPSKMV